MVNGKDENIKSALSRARCLAGIVAYNDDTGFCSTKHRFNDKGIFFTVAFNGNEYGEVFLPMFGEHNLHNALGCYALLHRYGLSHEQIAQGFAEF